MNQYGEMMASYNIGSRVLGHKDYVSSKNETTQGLLQMKSGDKIQGEVVAVDENLTIRIAGKDVVAAKDIYPSATVGDTIELEVLRQGDQQVVLKANTAKEQESKLLIMTKKQENDQEVFLSRKSYSSKQAEKDLNLKQQKQSIQLILSTMRAKDYSLLEGAGFDPNNMTITGIIEELSRKPEEIAPIYSPVEDREINIEDVKHRMKLYNLPEIQEMARKMLAALGLTKTIGDITKETVREILHRNQEPTVKNIYKAQFTRNTKEMTEMTEEEWNSIKPQVESVIGQAGYEVNESTLSRARWMVNEDIPLTADNVDRCNQLLDYKKQDQNQSLDNMIRTVKEGREPEDTWLISNDKQKTREWLEKIHEIDENTVKETIVKQMPITIESFLHIRGQQKKESEIIRKPLTSQQEYESLKAIRHLEEIRLKMTMDAALRLEKKGFHLETKPLEEVVNELRKMEETYYSEQFHQIEIDPSTEQMDLLRQTSDTFAMLKSVPSFVLGQTLEQRHQITGASLLDAGTKLAAEVQKASKVYENLMTRPISEYGDSIQKAFSNVGSILDELGLDMNTYNQRAVRILGYNQMEITVESIEEMKSYDRMVNSLLQNIHPAVTVRLIRDGINPLEMPLDELEEKVLQMKEAEGIDKEERFSNYLHRLERDHGITEDERRAYIGIYRLIHQINQSDGAALGAVIKAEQELTLGHMLTAIRTLKKGSMDTLVDDEFGALEKVTLVENSISNQINAIDQSYSGKSQTEKMTPYQENKLDVHDTIMKQMEQTITPQILYQMIQSWKNTEESSDIWNQIKDIPVEKLQDQIDQEVIQDNEIESVYQERLQELEQILKNSDQGVRFLEELKLPCTLGNLYYAEQILSHESSFYRSYQTLMDQEHSVEKQFIESLVDQESMESILDEMEEKIQHQIENHVLTERESNFNLSLTQLKQLGKELLFRKTLAKKEFYQIPVESDRGITTMNLTLIRGGESSGNVKITMDHSVLGDVKAEFTLKSKEVRGYLLVHTRDTYDRLKLEQSNMRTTIEDKGYAVKHFEVCFDVSAKEMTVMTMGDTKETSKEKEQDLYQFAKHMVQLLQDVKEEWS